MVHSAESQFNYVHCVATFFEHKCCAPGHSSIQELDSVHSHIEKSLNLGEIFSSFSFVRVLSKVKGDP